MAAGRNEKLRILGVDPGLITSGYGLIDVVSGEPVLVEGGVIRVPTKLPIEQRLSTVFHGVHELAEEFQPDAMALEEVYTHYERPRVAIMMGHARGVICLAAALNHIPLFSYAPTHIKSALTGNGRASKEQVRRMVEVRLKLKSSPEPLDISDALAVALCHMSRAGRSMDYAAQGTTRGPRRRATGKRERSEGLDLIHPRKSNHKE